MRVEPLRSLLKLLDVALIAAGFGAAILAYSIFYPDNYGYLTSDEVLLGFVTDVCAVWVGSELLEASGEVRFIDLVLVGARPGSDRTGAAELLCAFDAQSIPYCGWSLHGRDISERSQAFASPCGQGSAERNSHGRVRSPHPAAGRFSRPARAGDGWGRLRLSSGDTVLGEESQLAEVIDRKHPLHILVSDSYLPRISPSLLLSTTLARVDCQDYARLVRIAASADLLQWIATR